MPHCSAKLAGELFFTFFRIGAFTFGGGYAMIPLIQREAAERRGWIDEAELLDVVAVAESTPGPIAVNAATYVGWRVGGFAGALLATLGVILPSFFIILFLSAALGRFAAVRAVRYAFLGVKAGVLALILRAAVRLYRQCPKDALSCVLMGASFALCALLDVPVIAVLIGCALIGCAAAWAAGRRPR